MTDVRLNCWYQIAVLATTSLCANKWLIHPVGWGYWTCWLHLCREVRNPLSLPKWGHLLAVGDNPWFRLGSWWLSNLWPDCLSGHTTSNSQMWLLLGLTGSPRSHIQSNVWLRPALFWRPAKEFFLNRKAVTKGSVMLKKTYVSPSITN